MQLKTSGSVAEGQEIEFMNASKEIDAITGPGFHFEHST